MSKGYPGWFRCLFSLVMLAVCAVFAAQLIHRYQAEEQNAQLHYDIELTQKRLAKQQAEYDEYLAELPLVEAELAEVAPLAEAEAARVAELKAQRNALREENAALAAQLAALQQQAEEANASARSDHEELLQQLDEALSILNTILIPEQN